MEPKKEQTPTQMEQPIPATTAITDAADAMDQQWRKDMKSVISEWAAAIERGDW
jgi:hypothetical protein